MKAVRLTEQFAVRVTGVGSGQLAACRGLLTREKAARADRYHFDVDRVRCLVGETLIRYLAETRYGFPNSRLVFGQSGYGKPFLIGDAGNLRFNLSHAGDWVTCAIGTDEVGIDVEHVKEREVTFAKSVLSPNEYSRWKNLPETDRNREFYRLWTVKESYAKYLGLGLGLDFTTVDAVEGDDGFLRIARDDSVVLYTQFLTQTDILTVCTEKAGKDGLILKPGLITVEELTDFAERSGTVL